MRNRQLAITIVTLLLLGIAAAGYLIPEKDQKLPVRILFENNGGRVIFGHLKHHKDYEVACAICHHEGPEYQEDGEPLACGACHPANFDEEYVAEHISSFPDETYCVNCHHAEFGELAFDHDAHIDYAADDCQSCHHDTDIDPDTTGCGECHGQVAEGNKPSVREAAHERCSNCHGDMFEEGMKGCQPCHKLKNMNNYEGPFTSCSQCHHSPDPDRELVLTRMNAFHDQCMNCHEELKRGPYGDKACAQCHIR